MMVSYRTTNANIVTKYNVIVRSHDKVCIYIYIYKIFVFDVYT